jgi:excisionase family DNA binding protein
MRHTKQPTADVFSGLTTREAARYLGLSVPRIKQLIESGELKAVKWSRFWVVGIESLRAAKANRNG